MESPNFELNGWLSRTTLKKMCYHYDWDVNLINNVLSALAFLCKNFITMNKYVCKKKEKYGPLVFIRFFGKETM